MDSEGIRLLCRFLQHLQHLPADAVSGGYHPRPLRHSLHGTSGHGHDAGWSRCQLVGLGAHRSYHLRQHASDAVRIDSRHHEDPGPRLGHWFRTLWCGLRHHRHHRFQGGHKMVHWPRTGIGHGHSGGDGTSGNGIGHQPEPCHCPEFRTLCSAVGRSPVVAGWFRHVHRLYLHGSL